jgi:hypothetical protein
MNPRATPRVRDHVNKLREAGLDTQKFFDCLVAIRDDTALPKAHREAIYKLIAMESFVWYLEALRDEAIDRKKLVEEAMKLMQQHEAAIRSAPAPGETAAALATKDIGAAKPKIPGAATVNERRPSTPGTPAVPPTRSASKIPAATTKFDRPKGKS